MENPTLATVHFYRTKNIWGFAVQPKLRMNGDPISTIKWNWRKTITIPPGAYGFSAKTEATREIELQVEAGKEYYVRCAMRMGLLVGRIKFIPETAEQAQQRMSKLRAEQ